VKAIKTSLFVFVALLLISIGGETRIVCRVEIESYAFNKARNSSFSNLILKDYSWKDINSGIIVKIENNKIFLDSSVPLRSFLVHLQIEEEQLAEALSSFGIPEKWLKISYRSQAELRQKREELVREASRRGIAYDSKEQAFRVDYDWIIERSREGLKNATVRMLEVARGVNDADERRIIGVISSFVQALTYVKEKSTRLASNGESIFTAGVSMPVETLARGSGDCDTKCLLFASLVTNLRSADIVFLRGGQHLFAAIAAIPRPNDRYIEWRNKKYVLIELTDMWPLGRIPDENWRALKLKRFEVIPVANAH